MLIETTDLPFAQVVLGAGFASIRQFNDTVRGLRHHADRAADQGRGGARRPATPRRRGDGNRAAPPAGAPAFDGDGLPAPSTRAVPGVEEVVGDTYRRTLRLPHGPAVVELTPSDPRGARSGCPTCATWPAVQLPPADGPTPTRWRSPNCWRPTRSWRRSWPSPPVVARRGTDDGNELAVRAILGQQVSVVARTHTARPRRPAPRSPSPTVG